LTAKQADAGIRNQSDTSDEKHTQKNDEGKQRVTHFATS